MSTIEQILSGIIIALISGIIGKIIGSYGKVPYSYCKDHQGACQQLLLEKLTNMEKQLRSLTEIVNGKLLGL